MVITALNSNDVPQTLSQHDCIVWGVAFNDNGSRIVSWGDDGSIQIYVRQENVYIVKCGSTAAKILGEYSGQNLSQIVTYILQKVFSNTFQSL